MTSNHFLNDLILASMIPAILGTLLIAGSLVFGVHDRDTDWVGYLKGFLVIWLFYATYTGYDHFNGHPASQDCEERGRFGEFGACDDGPIP